MQSQSRVTESRLGRPQRKDRSGSRTAGLRPERGVARREAHRSLRIHRPQLLFLLRQEREASTSSLLGLACLLHFALLRPERRFGGQRRPIIIIPGDP